MKRTNEKFPQNLAGQLMALTQGLREHLGEEVFATAVITATRTGCRVQTVALDCLDAEAITWAAGEMIIAFSKALGDGIPGLDLSIVEVDTPSSGPGVN